MTDPQPTDPKILGKAFTSTPDPILGKALVPATQVRKPWRATVRTIFQAVVSAAAVAEPVYEAATHQDAAAAGGYAALGLAIAAGITRVMTLPAVNQFLARFLPFLAPDDPKTILGKA